MDDVVERAAEWGVQAVVPVSTERTVVKIGGRANQPRRRGRARTRASRTIAAGKVTIHGEAA